MLYDANLILRCLYLSLKGVVNTNNSVINFTEIGETDIVYVGAIENNGLQCITDTCMHVQAGVQDN